MPYLTRRIGIPLTLALSLLVVSVPAFGQTQRPESDGRYMIEFREFGPAAVEAVRAAGGVPVFEFPEYRVVAAWLPDPAVQGLRRNPNVVRVEEDPRRYPLATGQVTPYGIPMVQASLLSDLGAGNRKVCVIDSGYDLSHVDLPNNPATVTGYASGTGPWDVDNCGHGTHVAGTLAALNNTVGVVGVLPGGVIKLHIVKVFGDSCSWTYSSNLIDALQKCRDADANVVSMSLGGGKPIGPWEQSAFNSAYNAGVLSVAAAGNAGTTALSYPASYDSVISVAAIDENKVVADFSQKNNQVELAAPGVGVLSTVPYLETNTLAVDGTTYQGNYIEGAARSPSGVSGGLANGFRCTSTNSGWSGKVVLCERGDVSFWDKVRNVQNSGGVAAVIYNNEPGNFFGTLGAGNSSTIPAISLSREDGQFLVSTKVGQSGTVVSSRTTESGYEAWNGTSMATPHVSGVAALVWSYNQQWTNAQLRQALRATAEDLGPAGKDDSYGYGLVQARAALCHLDPSQPVCSDGQPPANQPPTASFTYSCSELTCNFTDASTDPDGQVLSWSWMFGDGSSSTLRNPSRTYSAGGTYTVTLKVTDNGGATDSTSQNVTVTDPSSPGGITLAATAYKVKGLQKVDLTWSGASSDLKVYRNREEIATVSNTGAYTDHIDARGGGSYVYQICEVDSVTTCSPEVTAAF
jgi:serine protease